MGVAVTAPARGLTARGAAAALKRPLERHSDEVRLLTQQRGGPSGSPVREMAEKEQKGNKQKTSSRRRISVQPPSVHAPCKRSRRSQRTAETVRRSDGRRTQGPATDGSAQSRCGQHRPVIRRAEGAGLHLRGVSDRAEAAGGPAGSLRGTHASPVCSLCAAERVPSGCLWKRPSLAAGSPDAARRLPRGRAPRRRQASASAPSPVWSARVSFASP